MWITFDLDGVLIRNPFRHGIFPVVAERLAPGYGDGPQRVRGAIHARYRRRLFGSHPEAPMGPGDDPAAPYDWDAIFREVAEAAGMPAPFADGVGTVVRALARQRRHIAYWHPSVRWALAALQQAGHRLAAVTNGLAVYQEPVVEALGLGSFFQCLVAPDRDGVAKPQAEAFHVALACLGARPEASVHVGDDLLYDVAAARRVGLRTIWVIPPAVAARADRVVRSAPPWERPAAMARLGLVEAHVEQLLDHERPPRDRALTPYAMPDAAVFHAGEVPTVVARWAGDEESAVAPAAEPVVAPLPEVGEALVAWFSANRRDLPWRRQPSPYRVLVAEFMLQQTQIATALPYFQRFMQRFPTIEALAAAPEEDVLALWQGLGYYRRARHLVETAREVVSRHGGRLPEEEDELRRLPGVGPYMAAAIASIAFGRPAVAIDGNAERVLTRLLGSRESPRRAAARRQLAAWARGMIPAGSAADFTQGLMELGSRVCRPEPACDACPVRLYCAAWAGGFAPELPVKAGRDGTATPAPGASRTGAVRAVVPEEQLAAVVALREDGMVGLVRRDMSSGLLGGLWELPWAALADNEAPEQAARRALQLVDGSAQRQVGPGEGGLRLHPAGTFRHLFSHRRWHVHVFVCRIPDDGVESLTAAEQTAPFYGASGDGAGPTCRERRWAGRSELDQLPMARAFRKVLEVAAPLLAGPEGLAS